MFKFATALPLALTLAFSVAHAHAQGPTRTAADFGAAVANGPVDRHIVLTSQTSSVNVNDGETVEFVIGERSYRWHFDTFIHDTNVELVRLIPQAPAIKVYIGRNPTYRSW
jgi:hypothetical protein